MKPSKIFNAAAAAVVLAALVAIGVSEFRQRSAGHKEAAKASEEHSRQFRAKIKPHVPRKLESRENMSVETKSPTSLTTGGLFIDGPAWGSASLPSSATDTVSDTGGTQDAAMKGCGFSAVTGTINSITVNLNLSFSGGTGSSATLFYLALIVADGGAPSGYSAGSDKSDGSAFSGSKSFTFSPADWGLPALTAADIKDSLFGVAIRAAVDDPDSTSWTATINSASISVDYGTTPDAGGGLTTQVPEGMLGAHGGGLGAGLNSPAGQALFGGASSASPTSGPLIFRRGFAATPVPTPLNPICCVAAEPPSTAPTLAELLAGGWTYRHGFLEAPAPALPVAVLVGRPEQDLWPHLLAGSYVSRYQLPLDPLPATQPYTVQTVGFAPGLGMPFDAVEGRYLSARGSAPPQTPSTTAVTIAAWPASDVLSAGLLAGALATTRGTTEAVTPTFAPPPAHVFAWEVGVELLATMRGQVIVGHGFAAALPVMPTPARTVAWPQGEELRQPPGSQAIAWRGFADALPTLPVAPVVAARTDDLAGLLSPGSVLSWQSRVTPQPAEAVTVCVAGQQLPAELLPAGATIRAHGFAGAQPDSPLAAVVVSASITPDILQRFDGSSLSARGFATGRLPPAPPLYIVSSEPPPAAAIAGGLEWFVGAVPPPDKTPRATVSMVSAEGEELLQPMGKSMVLHGFAGAQPASPVSSTVAAASQEFAALQDRLAGALLTARGFATGRLPPGPPLYVAQTEPPPVAALAGQLVQFSGAAHPLAATPAATVTVCARAGDELLPPAGAVLTARGFARAEIAQRPRPVVVDQALPVALLADLGAALASRGFAASQPYVPVRAVIVQPLIDESLRAALPGSLIVAHGFARGEPARLPAATVVASEPPPVDALRGAAVTLRPRIEAQALSPRAAIVSTAPPEFSQLAGAALKLSGSLREPSASAWTPKVTPFAADESALVRAYGEGSLVYNPRASVAPDVVCVC